MQPGRQALINLNLKYQVFVSGSLGYHIDQIPYEGGELIIHRNYLHLARLYLG